MKKSFFTLASGVFLIIFSLNSSAAVSSGIEILIPNADIITEYSEIRIVGLVHDEAVTQVNILINDSPVKLADVLKGAFLGAVPLKDGMNEIKVVAKDKDVGTSFVKVFYKKDTAVVPDNIQKDFKKFYDHKPIKGRVDACSDCHDLSDSKGVYPGRLLRGSVSCVSPEEGCHTDKSVKAYVYSHGPVGEATCTGCHSPHGTFNKFSLVITGSALCYRCHTDKEMDFARQFVHGPVGGGDCNACHDSHGGSQEFQLRGAGAELCYMCHKRDKANMKSVHGPVAAGDCNVCHNPHAAPYKFQLEKSPADICFVCHEAKAKDMQKEFMHKPVAERKCGDCHDSHTSDFKYQLKEDGSVLCWTCHKEKKEQWANVKEKHSPVAEGQCSKCHDAHASDTKYLLLREGEKLCYMCHQDKESEFNKPSKHGPVEHGDCVACHAPHGSAFVNILQKDFPKPFYDVFEESKYDLCFGCHKKTVVLEPFTATLTDFRNGKKNMHYVHVNKKKGRTCRACHEAHASTQEKHIRLEVPFSPYWNYKVEFTKTPTGGRCIVGCHKPRDYDRENPVPENEWY